MPRRTDAAAEAAGADDETNPEADVTEIGVQPARLLIELCRGIARANAQALENLVAAQQQTAILAQAATTQSVETLYALNLGGPPRPAAAPVPSQKDS